jgi:hypothetical protein
VPDQTRPTCVAFIATRKASPGEPRFIVGGYRLEGAQSRQFVGFFDRPGLEAWLLADAPYTGEDGLNCVFQHFRRADGQDAFYVPWAFPQSTIAKTDLFVRVDATTRRTIRVGGLERVAYFVDGGGAELQPLGPAWRSARPRLVLDLANPGSEQDASGSSLIIALRAPGASRRRPDFLILDHRLRHPLSAHAPPRAGDTQETVSRTAAALQLWHRNGPDRWRTEGAVAYPTVDFWAAGVSERNREPAGHPERAWSWTQTASADDGSHPATTLYGLASDTSAGLESRLRSVSWRTADPTGKGIAALSEKGLRPTDLKTPIKYFGLRRIGETPDGDPAHLRPVVGADFPLTNPHPGEVGLALRLPSGFAITRADKLDNRRAARAELVASESPAADPVWLEPASALTWRFSLDFDAGDLDLVPSPSGPQLPLDAFRELLVSRARARAIARGIPPLTFAPEFTGAQGLEGILRLEGELVDDAPHLRAVEPQDLRLDADPVFHLTRKPGAAVWPAVITHGGAQLGGAQFGPATGPAEDEETELGEDLGETDAAPRSRFLAQRARLRIAAPALDAAGESLRVGALDLKTRRFAAAATTEATKHQATLTFGLALARVGGLSGLRVRMIGRFPLWTATPAEPDRPPLDRDIPGQAAQLEAAPDRPLLLPLGDPTAAELSPSLHVSETFGWGLDPQLSMSLAIPAGQAIAPERWVVLGRLPMQVARLHMPSLAARADETDSQVAVWSSGAETGASWRLRDPDETARLILSPQGLGEAMEKGLKGDGYPDIEPNAPVEFRLTPPAVVEFDPSPLDSGFVEPTWNLDRIFGRPGVIEPGARLRRLAYELLYGMAGALSDSGLTNAQLRLSDIAARYGVPPSRLSRAFTGGDDLALQAWVDTWNSMRRTALTRPLALSVSRTDRLEAFELEGPGVDYRLRSTARLKYPIPNVPAPKRAPWRHAVDGSDEPTSESGHLAGGVGWAFESQNIVESVFAQPRSNAGRVRELTLTPLGGYGNVRGLFDSRRTAIEAAVALGRTNFYALERIGRIGALWNKAKHVIIYRREVVPSGQFYNEDPTGIQQDENTGRVILRKWEEYIEILQPERRYPDLADAAERTGFLRACRFHSKRIKVDSRWGSDIPGAGWMVPLWRSVFRNLKVSTEDSPAAIYPQPHISLVCAGRDGQEHEQEIKYPENLIFFTSTRPGETDDTDAWAVTERVDWADELWPEVPDKGGSGSQPHDAKLAKPVVAPPEQGRFVLEVVRGEPVAVAHGFDEEPPLAAIDSITISRASPAKPSPNSAAPVVLPVLDQLRGIVGDARAVTTNLQRELASVDLSDSPTGLKAGARKELARRTREARDALGGIRDAARSLAAGENPADRLRNLNPKTLVDDGCDEVKRLLQAAVDSRVGAIKDEVSRFVAGLDAELVALDMRLTTAGVDLDEALTKAASSLDGVFAVAFLALDRVEFAGLEAGGQVSARLEHVRDEVTRLFGVFDAWRQARAVARQGIDNLLSQARAVATAQFAAFRSEVVAVAAGIQSVRGSLEHALKVLDGGIAAAKVRKADVPAQAAQAFTDAVQAAEAVRAGLARELRTEVNEDDKPLLQFIEDKVAEWPNATEAHATAIAEKLQTRIEDLDDELRALEDDAEAKLREVARLAAEPLEAAAADLTRMLAVTWPAAIQAMRRPLEAWRTDLHTQLDRCRRLPDVPLQSARKTVADVRRGLLTLEDLVLDRLEGGARDLTTGAFALAEVICDELKRQVEGWRDELVRFIDDPRIKEIEAVVDEIAEKIAAGAETIAADITRLETAAKHAIDDVARIAEAKRAEFGRLIAAADRAAAKAESVLQKGDRALTLMRALGDPPKVELLDFNRPGVAYIFNGLEQRGVKLTPIVAQVNRAASTVAAVGQAADALNDLLAEFGLRIPFRELGKKLTPDELKNFELSKIFPQFGGLDLADLLGGERFPSLNGKYADALQISHGFKPEEGRAWLACKVNTPLEEQSGKPRRLFALGPVQLDLIKGHFGADARFEAKIDGGSSKKVGGAITGDWQLTVYGTRLVTFSKTSLTFDDSGKFDFDIKADKIQLADALQYIVQLLKTFGGETLSKVRPIESDGHIVGVMAPFTLSIGDLEFGAFSISAIQINCEFSVIVSPDFLFSVRADVNSKMNPFTLSVGTMIGGGYLTSYTQIIPARAEISQRMSIAVMAGIGRSLNVAGIARGHGYLQFGVEIELYFSTRGRGAGGAVIAFVIASGNLSILSIISCNITLRLETRYDTSGGASASGQLMVSIKISFFYTLNVDRAVNYALSGGGGGSYSDSFA